MIQAPYHLNKSCFDIVSEEIVWLGTCMCLWAVLSDIGRKRLDKKGGHTHVEAVWSMYPSLALHHAKTKGGDHGPR